MLEICAVVATLALIVIAAAKVSMAVTLLDLSASLPYPPKIHE